MRQITEILAQVKGVPVIIGLILVILSLLGHMIPGVSFLASALGLDHWLGRIAIHRHTVAPNVWVTSEQDVS